MPFFNVKWSGGSGSGMTLGIPESVKDIYACGYNIYGMLGIGSITDPMDMYQKEYVKITNTELVKNIVNLHHQTFLITKSDRVLFCGRDYQASNNQPNWTDVNATNVRDVIHNDSMNNYTFVYEDGTTNFTPASGLTNIKKICYNTRTDNQYVILNSGELYVMGANQFGELGLNHKNPVTALTLHPTLNNVKDVVGNSSFGYAIVLLNDGTVYAMGKNNGGALGQNTGNESFESLTPVQVLNLSNVSNIYDNAGGIFALVNNNVYAWGIGLVGSLGLGNVGAVTPIPTLISGLTDIIQISGDMMHTLFLKSDGTLYGCGDNTNECLFGQPSVPLNHITTPTQLTKFSNVTRIWSGIGDQNIKFIEGTLV